MEPIPIPLIERPHGNELPVTSPHGELSDEMPPPVYSQHATPLPGHATPPPVMSRPVMSPHGNDGAPLPGDSRPATPLPGYVARPQGIGGSVYFMPSNAASSSSISSGLSSQWKRVESDQITWNS